MFNLSKSTKIFLNTVLINIIKISRCLSNYKEKISRSEADFPAYILNSTSTLKFHILKFIPAYINEKYNWLVLFIIKTCIINYKQSLLQLLFLFAEDQNQISRRTQKKIIPSLNLIQNYAFLDILLRCKREKRFLISV